jgi:wyosine [tRNA(Phe)-imidazoG37] synthetase (radical SAM superfamily)
VTDLRKTLSRGQVIDYITLSGSGEPTLHSRIGWIIRGIKDITDVPIAVLTNGTLLSLKNARKETSEADLVIPSLDATSQKVFDMINRPHPSLRIDRIIEGLKAFRDEFKGMIWLEVMLVKGINDGSESIHSLRETVSELGCDKIQLNTVIRPPSEKYARPLGFNEMSKIKGILGEKCEIIPRFTRRAQKAYRRELEQQILDLLTRRPVGLHEISKALGIHENEVVKYLETLSETGVARADDFDGQVYYHR